MYSTNPTNPTPRKNRNEVECFNGFLKDDSLKFMAIDSFEKNTRDCKVFLLSHHHTDHMKGLWEFARTSFHQTTDQFIYTSPLTAEYIKNSYGIQSSKIVELPFNKSFVVYTLADGSDVTVTSVPSGHCPGAVMFVIEYNDKRILFTGDMRMNLDEFKKSQKYLMMSENNCRKIEDVYLDTTFALPESDTMPHRDQSTDSILNFAEEWLLDANPKKRIVLHIHTCIGCEYLYISLAKKFKTKILVHREDFNKFYAGVEELSGYFKVINNISEDEDWLIHACYRDVNGCTLQLCQNSFETEVIKPTALGFVNKYYTRMGKTDSNGVEYVKKDNWVGNYKYPWIVVYYSHHCSLEELKSIVKFINPKNIYLNTVYDGMEEVMHRLFFDFADTVTSAGDRKVEEEPEMVDRVGDGKETSAGDGKEQILPDDSIIEEPTKIDSAGDRKEDGLRNEKYLRKKKTELQELEKKLNLW